VTRRSDADAPQAGEGWLQRLAWPAFVAACLLNLYGVYWPSEPGPPVPVYGIDKVAHFCLFGLVAFTGRWVGVRWWILAPALVAQAVGSEVVQGTLESASRQGSVWDATADVLGAIAGWLAFAYWLRWRRGRPDRHG